MARRKQEFIAWLEKPRDRLRTIVGYDARGNVARFTIQYETLVGDEFVVVTRYDTAHGGPHQDVYDPHGNQIEKIPIPHVTLADALEYAETDLRRFWRVYRDRFQGDA
jgi:hypothetical protein